MRPRAFSTAADDLPSVRLRLEAARLRGDFTPNSSSPVLPSPAASSSLGPAGLRASSLRMSGLRLAVAAPEGEGEAGEG
eukprot:CAMPEP_0174884990 /NCGR_PEP_ID=MMETSP0167-20121228/388_1 /TAXON_ID=38298 /ORGANISM="Rhodella maculata, Strain CCMP736" /LENGTH=78 /DNA_ID=CAMNT_0016120485 /DNA_START=35 /DNA_END=267 /DNA_ORIENTATION=-